MSNDPVSRYKSLPPGDQSRLIEMAWEDRTPFEAIQQLLGFGEHEVIQIMRYSLKSGSFRAWRKRVSGRKTKHLKQRPSDVLRAYAPGQYKRN